MKVFLAALLSMSLAVCTWAQDASLQKGFEQPPDSAKPRVWWHWMNGNITKEGIKLDLEWMHRVGIGGFQNFDAALNTPKLVDKRLVYMTPEWRDAFKFATETADRLGLEEAIAGSPGWSESGGPWVTPQHAMKKFVWSETSVKGGQPFNGTLPKPPSISGPYQDIPIIDLIAIMTGQTPTTPAEYYADTTVIAYRAPDSDMADLHPKVTSSSGTIDAALLSDGLYVKSTALPKAAMGENAWVQFEFPEPQSIRSVTFALGGPVNPFGDIMGGAAPPPELEASDDGQSFHTVVSIPSDGGQVHTISFPETKARFFRLSLKTPPPAGPPAMSFDADFGDFTPPPSKEYALAEISLHSGARVNRVEEKAAFTPLTETYSAPTPSYSTGEAVAKSDVVDLTSKMKSDGTLDWTPPAGNWTVLRFGYSLLGITNHPASPEGTGFEVDKLNAADVTQYMNTYLDNYKNTVGDLMGKRGLQYVISDSWEAGAQNWTDDMVAEFTKRRGYDPRPWMPVLAGKVVESSESSDRFLWDFRLTLSDLLAENHYDLITKILHDRGMGHYGESHEEGRAFIGDGMQVKRSNDVPMSATWTQKPGVNKVQYGYDADVRESASVAHLYGQNLVAAESLTASLGAYAWSPATLKPTADQELSDGLNRFVIHTSVHQPLLDRKPGLALGPFGQWFNRNETWAEQAKPWVSYLTRSSYLLQQGKFAADIVYFYGEDSNLTALFLHKAPEIPAGYNWDYINADALIHLLSVKDGNLVTPSGMSYHVLALDPFSQHMSLPVLRKIRDLVKAGATVAGPKPISTPSLSDDTKEFQTIVDELWGSGKVQTQALGDVLAGIKVSPDFEFTKPSSDTLLQFVHRKTADADLYFVDNRNDRDEAVDATFRVQGKAAELWHSDTGKIEPASYTITNGRTTVPLKLEPWGTVFVVFRDKAKSNSRTLPRVTEQSVATVDGPWDVAFQADLGAPPKITMEKLISYPESSDEGVKYFGGTATYTKTVQADSAWLKGGRVWLDLGDVKNLAEVSINGKPLGIVWKKPFRVDATGVLKAGANSLEIKVINGWANRIIGDRQPGVTKTYTFTSPKFYKANAELMPSGLLGPVQIIQSKQGK
ncbi:MAG TPA: glycosyl hydrolase [Terriglobales bacterium]|jgi:hypothetical protein|nr:glycosyl hydrolase [Terriglobales bacterium]